MNGFRKSPLLYGMQEYPHFPGLASSNLGFFLQHTRSSHEPSVPSLVLYSTSQDALWHAILIFFHAGVIIHYRWSVFMLAAGHSMCILTAALNLRCRLLTWNRGCELCRNNSRSFELMPIWHTCTCDCSVELSAPNWYEWCDYTLVGESLSSSFLV